MNDLLKDIELLEEIQTLLASGKKIEAQVKIVQMAVSKEIEFERLEKQMEREAA
tara:strand:- start:675 stop:836 length:162 start_codon:yes stop_codon:yes gene_type:complete